MHKYKLLSKKGEGTFSEVIKAVMIKTNKTVAIKRMKNQFESIEQVNNLREIQALKRLSPHPCIIKLVEVLYDKPTGRLALVFELMDMNIYELIRGRKTYLSEMKVKHYMWQLLKAIDHMHKNGIFHRDIKPENLLLLDDNLKLADFGSCRGIKSKPPFTEYISTRWYRAPECLLTDGYYSYKMDLWGAGCVLFEIMCLYPLFPGANELDQIQKIHNIMGTPPAEVLNKMRRHSSLMNFNFPPKVGTGLDKLVPHGSPEFLDLLKKMLIYNPDERISARQALKHPYFKDFREAEKKAQAMAAKEEAPTTVMNEIGERTAKLSLTDKQPLPIAEEESPRMPAPSNKEGPKSLTDYTPIKKQSIATTSLESIHINFGKQEKDSQRDNSSSTNTYNTLPSVHRESGVLKASSEPGSNQVTSLPAINKKFGQTTQLPSNSTNNNNNNNNNTSKSIVASKLLQSFKKA